jgi:hypothetical protein
MIMMMMLMLMMMMMMMMMIMMIIALQKPGSCHAHTLFTLAARPRPASGCAVTG